MKNQPNWKGGTTTTMAGGWRGGTATRHINTHDAHRAEYETMGYKYMDIGGGAMIQQTIVIDADEYNALSSEVKACRANVRAAFRAGAEAARDKLLAEAMRLNQGVAERLIRDTPLPEMPE